MLLHEILENLPSISGASLATSREGHVWIATLRVASPVDHCGEGRQPQMPVLEKYAIKFEILTTVVADAVATAN